MWFVCFLDAHICVYLCKLSRISNTHSLEVTALFSKAMSSHILHVLQRVCLQSRPATQQRSTELTCRIEFTGFTEFNTKVNLKLIKKIFSPVSDGWLHPTSVPSCCLRPTPQLLPNGYLCSPALGDLIDAFFTRIEGPAWYSIPSCIRGPGWSSFLPTLKVLADVPPLSVSRVVAEMPPLPASGVMPDVLFHRRSWLMRRLFVYQRSWLMFCLLIHQRSWLIPSSIGVLGWYAIPVCIGGGAWCSISCLNRGPTSYFVSSHIEGSGWSGLTAPEWLAQPAATSVPKWLDPPDTRYLPKRPSLPTPVPIGLLHLAIHVPEWAPPETTSAPQSQIWSTPALELQMHLHARGAEMKSNGRREQMLPSRETRRIAQSSQLHRHVHTTHPSIYASSTCR